MDCIHARVLIVLGRRDAHELDADAQGGLDQHLEQCADCLAWSHQESRVDETLAQAIQAVPVPAQLPSKILHHLEHQRRPRRSAAWLSAAACLFLSLGIGGYLWYTAKPVLTVDGVYTAVSIEETLTAADVAAWFAEEGLPIEIPKDYLFEHYNGASVASLRGHRIPRLEFVNRGEGETRAAVVYVVSKDRFNVDDLVKAVKENPVIPTSKHQIEIRLEPDHPDFVYVIVYTGRRSAFFRMSL